MTKRIVKRISDPYIITAPVGFVTNVSIGENTNSVFTVNGNLVVTGNILLSGNTTAINTINTTVHDNIITLNFGEIGSGVTAGTSGVEIDRGLLPNAYIIWNETIDSWQMTNGVTTSNIAAAPVSGAYLQHIVQDTIPQLGANLDVNGFAISSNTRIQLTAPLQLKQVSSQVAVSGSSIIYAAAPSSGESGVYVSNSTAVDQELITRRKAIVYSLIF